MIWQTSTLDWTTGWPHEDADGGDDCTCSTGAREGQERSGDCPVAEVVAGDGEQVPALGRDRTPVRAAGSALSTAGGIPEGSGAAGWENDRQPVRDRLDYLGLFKRLQTAGYQGGYDAVRRYIRRWKQRQPAQTPAQAFVPLTFAPGEAYQFDWAEDWIVLDGVTTKVQVAHIRLCHSRMPFVQVYPRQTQEMVFDAHARALAF